MGERVKRIRQEVTGVVAFLGGIYVALSLLTYSRWDPSPFVYSTLPAGNWGGIVGAFVSDLLLSAAGVSAFIVPVALCVYGVRQVLGRPGHRMNLAGTLLLIFSSAVFAALITGTFGFMEAGTAGGAAGAFFAGLLKDLLSLPGAYIFAMAIWLSSVIMLSPVSLVEVLTRSRPAKTRPGKAEETGADDLPALIIEAPDDDAFLAYAEQMSRSEKEPVRPERPRPRREVPGPVEAAGPIVQSGGPYQFPPLELLSPPEPAAGRTVREDVNPQLLERKLRDFDIEGKIAGEPKTGPIVTMYEFEPAAGVKINRVVSLADDLALSLKAPSVRISAVSGTGAIGIEVPNRIRETVCLREILAAEAFRKNPSKLTLALGKDIFGSPVIADLAKMPHLLVAGATGSGKSVSINSMVVSLLYKASPSEVKMLMIDPKLLELSAYENIPHLVAPVVTNAKEAAEALRKMVFEMERRYRLLAEKGVRNIEGYNRAVSDGERLPYLVVFIDELADLMFASGNEVEDSIARLAQMARASGIHLILATQRPSVDVITGVIKANFPARIAFHVTSRIDSRTIIDEQGAEHLLGRGDMLFLLPGIRITRVHGALVTEDEIRAVADFVRRQGAPDYGLFESIRVEEPGPEAEAGERDEMYDKVLEFAEAAGEVSISSIQRRFKIGYNRAARIMELMEEDGLVGPQKAAGKARDFIGRRR